MRLARPAGPRLGPVVTPGEARRAIFQKDPELITALRPSSQTTLWSWRRQVEVRVNHLGTRGDEPSETAAQRVLALGDSFTLGLQVDQEETWPAVLEAGLDARLDRDIEVLNGGVDDFGTWQQLRLLRRLQPQVALDAVVLAFYLGNDLRDNRRRLPATPRGGRLAAQPLADTRAFESPSGGWSHLLYQAQSLRGRRARARGDETKQRMADELRLYTDPAALREQQGPTQRALASFDAYCRDHDLGCLLVLIPPELSMNPERAAQELAAAGLDPASADLQAPARAVADWAPAGLPVVDLGPVLAAGDGPAHYIPGDGHWNPQGHAVAAQALVEPVMALLAD